MVLRENIRSGRKTGNIEHREECRGESLLKKKKKREANIIVEKILDKIRGNNSLIINFFKYHQLQKGNKSIRY